MHQGEHRSPDHRRGIRFRSLLGCRTVVVEHDHIIDLERAGLVRSYLLPPRDSF